jgi:hypothetical protein
VAIDCQFLPVLHENCQKAIVIMLVVALQPCLGRQVFHPGPHEALPPAQEAFDLLLLLFVHLPHPFCQEGLEVVHHVRPLLFGYEVACCVFGKAGAFVNVADI